MDIRLASSGRLDTIRRIEYVTLLLMAVVALLPTPIITTLAAAPLAIIALAIVPGRKAPEADRAELRGQVVASLQQAALGLRSKWVAASREPETLQDLSDRWAIERETITWITECGEQVQRFPEIAGVLKAIQRNGNVLEELDAHLQTLSRLRRLMNLSKKLDLPI